MPSDRLTQRSSPLRLSPPESFPPLNAPSSIACRWGSAPHQQEQAAQPNSGQNTASAKDSAALRPLVFCIDDNPLICRQLGRVLTGAGYRYRSFQDSLQALCAVIEERPKLVFLDLVMPDMGGYELCSRIRQISALKDVSIVILSNSDRMVDRVRGKMAGANEHLTKPIRENEVLAVVERVAILQSLAKLQF